MASPPSSPTQAQIPVRQPGQTICLDHQSEFLFCCTECNEELVCRICVTSTHQGHNFDNISDVASVKRRKIQDYIKHVEETEIVCICHQTDSTHKQIEDSSENIKILIDKIKCQGEKLKTEIDRITDLFINICKEIQQSNHDLLFQYILSLQSTRSQLNDRLSRCKDSLDSGNDIAVIDVEKGIQNNLQKPVSPQLKNVEFTEGNFPSVHLQDDVGSLSIEEVTEDNVDNAPACTEIDRSSTSSLQRDKPDVRRQLIRHESQKCQQDVISRTRSVVRTRSVSASEAVPDFKSVNPKVVSEFKYPTNITSVKKATSDKVWVSWYNDSYISLFTLQGALKQKVEVEHSVRDITVSPISGNLWFCCYSDANVYELSGFIFKTPTIRFTTEYSPSALCATPNNTLVLCDDQHVVVYSTAGKELHSTNCAGKRVLVHPRHIAVCSTTGDIAVCDLDSKYHGGSDNSSVSIFDSNLNPKYKYHGPDSEVSRIMEYSFYPYDAVYEPKGRLLVADFMNRSIHLISKCGQFLSFVYSDVLKPRALTLIQDCQLLVGFDDKTVKVIKYTER